MRSTSGEVFDHLAGDYSPLARTVSFFLGFCVLVQGLAVCDALA